MSRSIVPSSRQALQLRRRRRATWKRARLWVFTIVACTAIVIVGPELRRDEGVSNLGPATRVETEVRP